MGDIIIVEEVPPGQLEEAARLYWQAFAGKLGVVLGPKDRALGFLVRAMDGRHALSALDRDGTVIGIAGYTVQSGGFIRGGMRELRQVYGWFGGTWRGLVLSVLERPYSSGTFLMDGLVVDERARGRGVGTELLRAIRAKAIASRCTTIRLDVIDTNPRARAMYERFGFVVAETQSSWLMRIAFGFRNATRMVYPLDGPVRPEARAALEA